LIYLAAFASAIVTGALFALMTRLAGIEHHGILIAVTVMGGGLQLILLIVWFLFHTKAEARSEDESRTAIGVEDANL
jgi:hypothetical protein